MKAKMKLVMREGPQPHAEYPLDADVIRLGRETARTIPLHDPQISQHHADIIRQQPANPEQWVIRDAGSSNGTYINQQRLTGERLLQTGDQIQIGHTVLTYEEVESGRTFRNFVAILIALSTLVGAFLAWQISFISDSANSADIEGMTAWVRLTQVRTDVYASLAINQRAFSQYNWQWVMSARLAQERDAALERGDTAGATRLEAERLVYAKQAGNSLDFVDRDYAPDIGSPTGDLFESERFLVTNEAEQTSRQDVDYQAHFDEADRLRLIAQGLMLATIILSLSVFSYTAAQLSETRLKFALLAAGVLLFLAGVITALFVRIGGTWLYNLFS